MNIPTCPKCHRPNVQERTSARTGRKYLANVACYPSGASYFRSLHTREECAATSEAFDAKVAETIRREAAAAESNARFVRGQMLTARFAAIYGREATGARWDAIATRWLA